MLRWHPSQRRSRREPPRLQRRRRSAPRSPSRSRSSSPGSSGRCTPTAHHFPRLSTILVEFQDMWLFSQFATHVVPSLVSGSRSASGSPSSPASRSGSRSGSRAWTRKLAMPHIEYWRAMPPPALLPISIVLLHDIGNKQKVAFIAFFCIFPVLLNTIDGVRSIDPTLVDTARSYRIPRRERIRRIVLPGRAAADRRRDADEPLARRDHDGARRVLLEHERRRLRPPDLEEHVRDGADVGGDPADRPARLPAQPRSSCSPSGARSPGTAAGAPRPRT